jgi:hypothetical protein
VSPLPRWIASYKGGPQNWDYWPYTPNRPLLRTPGWRYCCFPSCGWLLPVDAVACLAHTDLVGGPKDVNAAGALADSSLLVADQPFDYELAVDELMLRMVEEAERRAFG